MKLTKEIITPERKTVWFCGCGYHYDTGEDYFTHESGHEEIENKALFRTEYICTLTKKYMIENWENLTPPNKGKEI